MQCSQVCTNMHRFKAKFPEKVTELQKRKSECRTNRIWGCCTTRRFGGCRASAELERHRKRGRPRRRVSTKVGVHHRLRRPRGPTRRGGKRQRTPRSVDRRLPSQDDSARPRHRHNRSRLGVQRRQTVLVWSPSGDRSWRASPCRFVARGTVFGHFWTSPEIGRRTLWQT